MNSDKLIRLAQLRAKVSADKAKTPDGARKLYEEYLDGLTPEGRRNTKKKPQDFYEKPSKDDNSGDKSKSEDKPSVKLEKAKKKVNDDWSSLIKKEQDANQPIAYIDKLKANKALNKAVSVAKGFGVDFDLKAKGITKEFWGEAKQKDYVKLDGVVREITRKLEDKKTELEMDSGKKASFRNKLIRIAHENPELRAKLLPLIRVASK